jgi:molecular chaperone GrpE
MSTKDTKEGWIDPDPGADDGTGAGGPTAGAADGDAIDADLDEQLIDDATAFAAADPDLTLLPDPPGAPAPAGEAAEYRDALLRVKADFENYKKRIAKDHAATVERAAEKLVVELLPVLDACEAAIVHGVEGVEPVYKSLVDILEKNGLVRLAGEGSAFDPNLHDAVLHEPGDGGEPLVSEVLRSGYTWNGRVLRAEARPVRSLKMRR